jgi:hypothetical protein
MMDDTDYAIRARQVIEGWERMGLPSSTGETNRRIIVETIERLRQIIERSPAREATLSTLISRYEAMGEALKRAQH